MRALGPQIRRLADEAWAQGRKDLSGMLHDAARLAAEEEDDKPKPKTKLTYRAARMLGHRQ